MIFNINFNYTLTKMDPIDALIEKFNKLEIGDTNQKLENTIQGIMNLELSSKSNVVGEKDNSLNCTTLRTFIKDIARPGNRIKNGAKSLVVTDNKGRVLIKIHRNCRSSIPSGNMFDMDYNGWGGSR